MCSTVFIRLLLFPNELYVTEMLEICIQTSYDQNVQLILKSYLPVVYGTPLTDLEKESLVNIKYCRKRHTVLYIPYNCGDRH
jgi:hypothetical protein